MFEFNGKQYELKYNLKRVELIESAMGEPLMAVLQKNRGYLSVGQLKVSISLALKEAGSDTFIPPKTGQELAEQMIETQGYETVDMLVVDAVQRDCPFFFPAG